MGTNQGIAEIPRMFGKYLVIDFISHGTKILDGKDGCGASIPLAEGMDLPDVWYEFGNMLYLLIIRKIFVLEFLFLIDFPI